MHRNLIQPSSNKLGFVQNTLNNDPKRDKVRQMLHKHFEMKQEMNEKKNFNNNEKITSEISEFFQKDDESEIYNTNNEPSYYKDLKNLLNQPSCGETMQF